MANVFCCVNCKAWEIFGTLSWQNLVSYFYVDIFY